MGLQHVQCHMQAKSLWLSKCSNCLHLIVHKRDLFRPHQAPCYSVFTINPHNKSSAHLGYQLPQQAISNLKKDYSPQATMPDGTFAPIPTGNGATNISAMMQSTTVSREPNSHYFSSRDGSERPREKELRGPSFHVRTTEQLLISNVSHRPSPAAATPAREASLQRPSPRSPRTRTPASPARLKTPLPPRSEACRRTPIKADSELPRCVGHTHIYGKGIGQWFLCGGFC